VKGYFAGYANELHSISQNVILSILPLSEGSQSEEISETCKKDRIKCTIEDYKTNAQPLGYSRCRTCKQLFIHQQSERNCKVYATTCLDKPMEFWRSHVFGRVCKNVGGRKAGT
jgi:hypothetical protein